MDYVDVCFLHRPDYGTPMEETVRAMNTLIQQNKIFYVSSLSLPFCDRSKLTIRLYPISFLLYPSRPSSPRQRPMMCLVQLYSGELVNGPLLKSPKLSESPTAST